MLNEKTDKNFEKGLFKGSFFYILGSIVLSGISFLTVPVFTRLLNPSEFGLVNTYNVYVLLISIIISLGLNYTIKNARYEFRDTFNEYMRSIIIFSVFVFLIFIFLVNIFSGYLAELTGLDRFVLNLVIANSYSFFLINTYIEKYNIEFKYSNSLKLSYAYVLSGLGFSFILVVILKDKTMGRILGTALPTILIGVLLLLLSIKNSFSLRRKNQGNHQGKHQAKYLSFAITLALPFMFYQIMYHGLSQFDRVLVKYFIGDREAGIYSLVYNIGLIMNVVYNALFAVWSSWFYKKMDEKGYTEIRTMSKFYIIIFTFITLALLAVSPELVKIMAPAEYWEGGGLVTPVALAIYFLFLFSMPLSVCMFYKKNISITLVMAVAASVNILLNVLLLPKYGYRAAAYTSLAAYVLLFILQFINYKRVFKEKLYSLKYILALLVFTCGSAVLLAYFRDIFLIRVLYVFVAGLAAGLIYREELTEFFKSITRR